MADGSIIIDTQVDNSGAQADINKLGSELSSIAKTGLKVFTGALIAAGTALTGLGAIGINLASDLQEVQNVVDVTFGDNANKINDWAKGAADAFGMSELQAKQFTGTMGAMLKSMGLTGEEVLNMSESMVGLAGDFASFYNLPLEEAFMKIRAGISGETEPLKALGINMSVANLNAFALAQGLDKTYDSMTQAEQATLRYNYLMSTSADAQGDFARTSDSFANQMRVAQLNMQSLGAELGNVLLPIVQESIKAFNGISEKLRESLSDPTIQGSIQKLADAISELVTGALNFLVEHLDEVIDTFTWIIDNSGSIAAGIAGIGAALLTLNVIGIVSKVAGVMKLLYLEIATGTPIMEAFNIVLGLNPFVLIVTAVVALITALVVLWNTNEGFRNALIGAWNAIKDAGIVVWEWLVNFFTVDIPNAFNAVIEFFQNNWQGILLFLVNPFVGGFQLLYDNCEGFRNFINNFITAVGDFLKNGWQAIVNFFTVSIPAWIQSVVNWFNELPGKIGFALGYVLATIVKWGVDTWNYLVTNVPVWIDNITNFFSQLPGKIGNWLANTLVKIALWGAQTYSSMVNAVSNAINAVENWFSQLPGRIWTWLINTISKVGEFASNLGAKASQAGSNMFNNIINAVVNLPSRMASIGSNIVQGVWNGITGMGSWLASKVSSFFSGIVDGAKAALGIHSPSRVFRDEVGKYMAQGVGVGFEDETENIKADMQNSLSNLTAKMQATVDYETNKTAAGLTSKSNVSSNNSSVTNNNDNGLTLNIENFNNESDKDIETIATELAWFIKRKGIWGVE